MISFKTFFYIHHICKYGLKANRSISENEEIEIDKWCKEMIEPSSYISIKNYGTTKIIGFENDSDRMLFMMAFSGKREIES